MLMEFSPVTSADSWVSFLPKNTLSPLLESELGKENLLFYQTDYDYLIYKLFIIINFFTVNNFLIWLNSEKP